MPGSQRSESDPYDREVSAKVPGEKVSGHSSGPSRVESLRDDDNDLRAIHSRA